MMIIIIKTNFIVLKGRINECEMSNVEFIEYENCNSYKNTLSSTVI